MAYTITSYSRKQAKKIGVTIKKSKVKGKKIAVFKKGKKVAGNYFRINHNSPSNLIQYQTNLSSGIE